MPAIRPLFRLAVLALGASILASCGGDNGGNTRAGARDDVCPDEIPLRATTLPGGFDSELKKGAGKDNAPKDVVVFHYEGPGEDVIEVFRGGKRSKISKGGDKVRVLGHTARIKEISGGVAATLRLGRGKCSQYQYEGFGISKEELTKVMTGLRRGGASQDDDEPEATE